MRRIAIALVTVLTTLGLLAWATPATQAAPPVKPGDQSPVDTAFCCEVVPDLELPGNCLVTWSWTPNPQFAFDHYEFVISSAPISTLKKRWYVDYEPVVLPISTTSYTHSATSGSTVFAIITAVTAGGKRSQLVDLSIGSVTC